jgi:hypothetical protein
MNLDETRSSFSGWPLLYLVGFAMIRPALTPGIALPACTDTGTWTPTTTTPNIPGAAYADTVVRNVRIRSAHSRGIESYSRPQAGRVGRRLCRCILIDDPCLSSSAGVRGKQSRHAASIVRSKGQSSPLSPRYVEVSALGAVDGVD